jgi:hypothetical protein
MLDSEMGRYLRLLYVDNSTLTFGSFVVPFLCAILNLSAAGLITRQNHFVACPARAAACEAKHPGSDPGRI